MAMILLPVLFWLERIKAADNEIWLPGMPVSLIAKNNWSHLCVLYMFYPAKDDLL
jgi:hypothetical protein